LRVTLCFLCVLVFFVSLRFVCVCVFCACLCFVCLVCVFVFFHVFCVCDLCFLCVLVFFVSLRFVCVCVFCACLCFVCLVCLCVCYITIVNILCTEPTSTRSVVTIVPSKYLYFSMSGTLTLLNTLKTNRY